MARHPSEQSNVIPGLFYKDPAAALAWLERAFGLETRLLVTDPSGAVAHAEMSYGAGRIMIGPGAWIDWAKSPNEVGGANTAAVHIMVDDVDAHCATARAAGAVITMEPEDQFYGDRSYRARDPEGHNWTFGQNIREVSEAEMEAVSGHKVVQR